MKDNVICDLGWKSGTGWLDDEIVEVRSRV